MVQGALRIMIRSPQIGPRGPKKRPGLDRLPFLRLGKDGQNVVKFGKFQPDLRPPIHAFQRFRFYSFRFLIWLSVAADNKVG